MKARNQTEVSDVFLLGLTDDPRLQPLLFDLFLSMYLITMLGNLLIILAVTSDPHLHTPMYFFLSSLSFNDICLSSTTVPKMLSNIHTQDHSITYTGCLAQIYFVIVFACLEHSLLAVMAYDRYVAICHPLRYTAIMHPSFCVLLLLLSLLVSIMDALLNGLMMLRLSFCAKLEVPHFFCELIQIIKLSCSDTFAHNILIYVVACVFGGVPLSGIISSYSCILSSILHMPSPGGKHKAFSTCGSHLCVVVLFYGTCVSVYIGSTAADSPRKIAVASVMYAVVPQMLNPFIYSLRNRDMKGALRRVINNKQCWKIQMDPLDSQEGQIHLASMHPLTFGAFFSMEPTNETTAIEFLLLGLTDNPELQALIFSLFLSIYLITVLGNLLIILAVSADPHLHTPMYFFLSILSFTDVCISTTTVPQGLLNIQARDHSITYAGCLAQISSVLTFGGLENCLLVVMAYDRYVAICHPLRYTVIMHPGFCVLLLLCSLFLSAVHALLHSLMVLRLSFCQDVEIPHFFCELSQVLKTACSDTLINNLLIHLVSSLFFGMPLVGIIFSYAQILSSILRLPSAGGKSKAFSTCGSHLCVVSLFYGTGFSVYMSSAVTGSSFKNVVASMMYIVIPQMLNPFIYSLRNKEMKGALRHLICSTFSFLDFDP
ncbi:LOW QUALITY PROTEIN: uncharacterized protein RHO17_019375 [Thomomys bottae]